MARHLPKPQGGAVPHVPRQRSRGSCAGTQLFALVPSGRRHLSDQRQTGAIGRCQSLRARPPAGGGADRCRCAPRGFRARRRRRAGAVAVGRDRGDAHPGHAAPTGARPKHPRGVVDPRGSQCCRAPFRRRSARTRASVAARARADFLHGSRYGPTRRADRSFAGGPRRLRSPVWACRQTLPPTSADRTRS